MPSIPIVKRAISLPSHAPLLVNKLKAASKLKTKSTKGLYRDRALEFRSLWILILQRLVLQSNTLVQRGIIRRRLTSLCAAYYLEREKKRGERERGLKFKWEYPSRRERARLLEGRERERKLPQSKVYYTFSESILAERETVNILDVECDESRV